jgi:membrane carboxypeptidase/penicillin-binding protein
MSVYDAKKIIQRLFSYIALHSVESEWERLKSEINSRVNALDYSRPIDMRLIVCLILAEDRRHGRHLGFDILAICRAIWRRLTTDKIEGASTVAQQLVRTLTNRRERTVSRKINEIYLSILVTQNFQSSDIARVYLHVAYYGWRMNNLSEACKRLGLNMSDVSEVDAASLVARLKYPEPHISPIKRHGQIQHRTQYLLDLLGKKPNLLNYNVAKNEAF